MKSNTNQAVVKPLFTTKTLASVSLLTALSIILARVFGILVPIAGFPALKINFSAVPLVIAGIFYGPAAGVLAGAVSDIVGYVINPMGGAFFPGFTLTTALCGFIPGLIFKAIKSEKIRTDFSFNYINAVAVILLAVGVVEAFFMKEVLSIENGVIYFQDEKLSAVYIALYAVLVLVYIFTPVFFNRKERNIDKVFSLDKIIFTVTITQIITSLMLNTWFLSILFGKGFMVFLPARILTSFILIPLYSFFIYTLAKYVRI